MRLIAIPLTIVMLILGWRLSGPIVERWEDSNANARAIAAIQAQDYQRQTEATAASRALASNAGYLGAGALAVLLIFGLVDFYRQRREPIVRVQGLPIARKQITDEDQELVNLLALQIRASGIAQIETARRVELPAHLNYSPRIETITETTPAQITAEPDAPLMVVKPQAEWLRWIDEQPHSLLAGKTKAGKTTLATVLLAERLRSGEPVFIIDPHASGWLGLPTAGSISNKGELARALGAVLGEYLRRMKMRDDHKRQTGQELPHDYWPRMTVLVDEANAIADDLRVEWRTVAKQLASGSRKVGISLLILAQSPLVEDLGISGSMRENFARIALDDRTVAQMIDGEKDKPRREALRLALQGVTRPAAAQIGPQVWLLDRADMAPGAPVAKAHVWDGWDYQRGSRAAIRVVHESETVNQGVNHPVNHSVNQGGSPLPSALNDRIAQVRAMLAKKAGFNEIVRSVWGVEGKGKGYQQAADELREIIAAIAGGAA